MAATTWWRDGPARLEGRGPRVGRAPLRAHLPVGLIHPVSLDVLAARASGLVEAGTLPRPHVPSLASDVDVRYFDRKHTVQSGAAGLPAATDDAAAAADATLSSDALRSSAAQAQQKKQSTSSSPSQPAMALRSSARPAATPAYPLSDRPPVGAPLQKPRRNRSAGAAAAALHAAAGQHSYACPEHCR